MGLLDGWQQTRVLTAAQFTGRCLLVQVMTLRRGASTLLHLRVSPKQKDDPDVDRWRYGVRWAYPAIPPVWPLANVDPWEEASYFGALPGRSECAPEQSCRSCGAARIDEAKYCGQCGTRFDTAEILFAVRVAQLAGDITGRSSAAGSDLAALIDAYTEKSARFKIGRVELLQFIEADFAESGTASFIRGEPANVSPDLVLASAQDIHETVAASGRVRPEQVQHAELLLRHAPLHFGYWGPFKALVKSVPVDDMPDAYADALARLSSVDWSRPAPQSVHIEDTSFLSGFFDTASRDTLAYLARRVRRDLAALANRSPDTYARVAARMLLSWDRNLSRNAFAPAYVMLGLRSPLDAHSHRVVLRPDMSSRRDAHPEIWNDRPELVQLIFDNAKNSVEAHTWSFQVLESLGQAPAITVDHLNLGLLSTYPAMNLAACAALSSRPGLWGSLTVAEWAAFFRNADDSNIAGLLDAMPRKTLKPAAIEAAREFLVSGASKTPSGLLRISLMFLSATRPIKTQRLIDDADADVAAVVAVISQSGMKHKRLWIPIVKGLDVEHLERVHQALPDNARNRAASSAIGDLLLRKRAEQADPAEATNWIASANALEAELGWGLLDGGHGLARLLERLPRWIARRLLDAPTVERIISELFPRATLDDVPRLQQVVLQALGSGVRHANLVALLTNTPLGRAVIWHAMSTQPENELAALVNSIPEAVRTTGDGIEPDQLMSATSGQVLFVLRYITGNPDRIAEDAVFGVAAAVNSEPALHVEAIRQLKASGQLSQVWLALAESTVPNALAMARDYLALLNDVREFRDAVLVCLDSRVPAVRDLGTRLLHERLEGSKDRSLWTALAESDDSRIQELVAAEALVSDRVDERVLPDFDRRVLVANRRNRRAKESVKARLEATPADSGLAVQERITALMELARGRTVKDREWALGKLTELALAGVTIDGLDVSLVTSEDAS